MDLSAFASPWEHARLLSDRDRNDALLELLRRHAPGRRVLEVGCGTGLLSCVAAKMGASKVYAVEPTGIAEIARDLVRRNGLDEIVEIVQARVQDAEPRPVDFAFSELLNAEPYSEEVIQAMAGAKPWLAPGGRLSPTRLRVKVAVVRAGASGRESRAARAEVERLGRRFGLSLGPLEDALSPHESYKFLTSTERPVSTIALVHDIGLGDGEEPPEHVSVEVRITEAGPIAGAVIWFEADLDDDLGLSNPPGPEGHWGQMVCSWAEEHGSGLGHYIKLDVVTEDGEVDVTYAGMRRV